jgi:hypothetical protein
MYATSYNRVVRKLQFPNKSNASANKANAREVFPAKERLLKIPCQKPLECRAVAGFVPCHFADRAVNRVQALFLSFTWNDTE